MQNAISEFFSSGKLLRTFCCTSLTLASKVKVTTYVEDYKLIAYYTTFYKLITKLLTNRIKSVINTIISPSQSTFIERRNIINNILFSHELLNILEKGYL